MRFAEFFAARGRDALRLLTPRRVLIYGFALVLHSFAGACLYAVHADAVGACGRVMTAVASLSSIVFNQAIAWNRTFIAWLPHLVCGVLLGFFTLRKTFVEALPLAAWQALLDVWLYFGLKAPPHDLVGLGGGALLFGIGFMGSIALTTAGAAVGMLGVRLILIGRSGDLTAPGNSARQ